MFHNIFKYMIFQRRQKALLWSKGLCRFKGVIPLKMVKVQNLCNFAQVSHLYTSKNYNSKLQLSYAYGPKKFIS